MRNPFVFLYRKNKAPLKDATQTLFKRLFPRAINVEWSVGKHMDEAIFYLDGKESIACFKKSSDLIEYRINHDIHDLPPKIETAASNYGEIMNAISIHKSVASSFVDCFEIIYRNKDFVRYSLLLGPEGETLSVSEL